MSAAFTLPDLTLAALLAEHAHAQKEGARVLVLTVNNRQARHLIGVLAARLRAGQADQDRVMALPDIVPYQAWVQRLIEQQAFARDEAADDSTLAAHRVDSFGSLLLWQAVIREREADHYLLNTPQAARLAREADQLLSNWRLTVPAPAHTPDSRRFALWRAAYRARLAALDAQDDTLGLEQVCARLVPPEEGQNGQNGSDACLLPFRLRALGLDVATLVLAGFNDIHPRLWQILTACQTAGSRVVRLAEMEDPATQSALPVPCLRRIRASSPQQEWQQAVAWAQQRMQAQPGGRVAIIAPQLQTWLAFAHRLLHASLPAQDWNIALARPLADWPMVQAALAWLRVVVAFGQGGCPPALVGAALRGGHCVAHAREAGSRSRLDARWRYAGVLHLSQDDFIQALQRYAPRLAAAWEQVQAYQTQTRTQIQTPTGILARVAQIKTLLSLLGFPGLTAPDSTQHQILQALERALDTLGRQQMVLADTGGHVSFARAVQALQTLLAQTGFQPQRSAAARLDVLGLLEAQGGRWDAVWVLGLTDAELPSAPKPNPFIPLAVQREAATPRATPQRELQWARDTWHMLTRCAPDVTVSCAALDGECELRPSPFIAAIPVAAIPVATMPVVAHPIEHAPAVMDSAVMESVVDDQGPPWAAPPGQRLPGGVGVLEAQSRNPLWAFVKYRLHARQLPAHALNLADRQHLLRGTFLHACVEAFCTRVRSHAQLMQLMQPFQMGEGTALASVLAQAVEQAARQHLHAWSPALRKLECARALDVLHAWAQLEAQRSPYEIVALEQPQRWEHGGVCLDLKLDRVDRLVSDENPGAAVILDYKTGMSALRPQRDWLRQPPVNLQLPLYATTLGNDLHHTPVCALAWIRLHARKVQALGLGRVADETGLAGVLALNAAMDDAVDGAAGDAVNTGWPTLLETWHTDLRALASAYASGRAANFTRQPDDLRHCDVLPFLRLHEQGRDSQAVTPGIKP